jgi:hypothetical protein
MGAILIWNPGSTGGNQANGTNLLAFEVVVNENPVFPTTITEHVVEQGADISDNVRVGLKTLTLEVFVTNEPIDTGVVEGNGFGSGAFANGGPLFTPASGATPPVPTTLIDKTWFTLPVSVPILGSLLAQEVDVPFVVTPQMQPAVSFQIAPQVLQFATPGDFVRMTHDALDLLRTSTQFLTVLGTKGQYDNMIIEHFDMARSSDTGTGATFTIALKEIRLATSSIVNAPVPTKPRGNIPTHKGTTAPTPVAPVGGSSSLAALALSGLQGLFNGQTTPNTVNP